MKTMPYIILRLVVYGIVGVATTIVLGLLFLLTKVFGSAGAIIFLIGLALVIGGLQLVKRYVLYIIKAGHIAVITELIHKGALPDGVNQVEYGKQVVTERFKEVSVLFVIDQLVSGIIKAFNRTVVRVADFLPIPGLEGLAKFVTSILYFALTYVDEAILSYNLNRPDENHWESSRRGVVLYAQNWKPILQSAFGLAIVNIVAIVVLVLIMLIPFGGLALMAAEGSIIKPISLAAAIVFALVLKAALVNPLCLISMICTYNTAIANQEPNPEWEAKLEQYSKKFRELKDKAVEAVRSAPPVSKPAPVPAEIPAGNGSEPPVADTSSAEDPSESPADTPAETMDNTIKEPEPSTPSGGQ